MTLGQMARHSCFHPVQPLYDARKVFVELELILSRVTRRRSIRSRVIRRRRARLLRRRRNTIPPPASELADLVLLYRRRRDAIAIDLGVDGTGEEAELQALSVVCHQYVKKFGGSREDAGRIMRPLTVGRR
jgi:hypothetical protein